jgi:hypothetical protein
MRDLFVEVLELRRQLVRLLGRTTGKAYEGFAERDHRRLERIGVELGRVRFGGPQVRRERVEPSVDDGVLLLLVREVELLVQERKHELLYDDARKYRCTQV